MRPRGDRRARRVAHRERRDRGRRLRARGARRRAAHHRATRSRPMAAPRREGDPSAIWADTRRAEADAGLARDPHARRHRRLGLALAHGPSRRLSPSRRPRRDAEAIGVTRRRPALTVAYVMSRFPKLTETFILAELEAMDRAGVRVELYPLLRQTRRAGPAGRRALGRARALPAVPVAGRSCAASGRSCATHAGGGATCAHSPT